MFGSLLGQKAGLICIGPAPEVTFSQLTLFNIQIILANCVMG